MSGLTGARAIVTGGAQGIGAAIACGLADAGASVLVADINLAGAQATAARIGGSAIAAGIDVRDRATVRAAVQLAVDHFGGLDAMFNNAGIIEVANFLDITEQGFRTVMDVNALGVLIGTQEAAAQMIAQGTGGAIINTSSIAGRQGYEPIAHYCASKFAVIALTQAAAKAFGSDNIRVNAIAPGTVDTDMWKTIDRGFRETGHSSIEGEAFNKVASGAVLGRPSKPEDLIGAACFLASSASAFITGQTLMVDGGVIFG